MDSDENSFIFILLRTFVCFILILIFSSCAIHWKFPFICFEKACLVDQWHIRDIRASIKKMKGNSNKRQQKRNAKRRKGGEKETDTNTDSEYVENDIQKPEKEKNDSVLSFKPNLIATDTIIVIKFSGEEDSILIEDELFLKRYIDKHHPEKISQVILQAFYVSDDKHRISKRIKRLTDYLKELKIPAPVIIHNRSIHLKDGETNERIELRVK